MRLQFVVETHEDRGFIARAFICDYMAVDDENIGAYEAAVADVGEDAAGDPDAWELTPEECYERRTGERVPGELAAEYEYGDLYLIATSDRLDELTDRVRRFGAVSLNLDSAGE